MLVYLTTYAYFLVGRVSASSCREDLMLDGTKSSLYSVGKNVPLVTISTESK